MKTYALIITILWFVITPLYSQETSDTTDLRKSTDEENLLESIISEDEDSKLLDFLNDLKKNPFDLNKVTATQLETIPYINSIIAKKIVGYRSEIKKFKSKRELLKIEGINEELYEKIKIYLVIRQGSYDILIDETGIKSRTQDIKSSSRVSIQLNSKFLQELQQKTGYLNGNYPGSRAKIYNKLNGKFISKDFSIRSNITLEKDPGEKYLNDFISGFAELRNYKFVKEIVAGDYTLNFAQGLSMWNGYSFSKGSDAVNHLKKKGKEIDGYSSSTEDNFFRGAAAKFNFSKINFDLFYSDNFFNASIDTNTNGVSSFYNDGYHRTETELKRKHSVKEKLFGARVMYESGSIRIGSTYWTSKFSRQVISDSIKQLYKFSGTKANMSGIDFDFIFSNMNFFGEWAKSQSGAIASINGVQLSFYKFADLLFTYRNYPKDFVPVHSYGFGERNGDNYNEKGFYAGISLKPVKGLLINAYFDQYEFPYRTYFNPVPTSGNDFLLNADWKALKGFSFILKYKNENKEESRTVIDSEDRAAKKIDNRNQQNLRTGFIYQLSEMFRIRSRFEYVFIDYKKFGGDNKGYMFFSDLRISPVRGFVFDLRIIFFNTDDYDSRIYEFENDIKGVMSNVALYGKGRRWYVVAKLKPIPQIELSAKYAETFYDGAKSIGTGNDKITGDVNNKLSIGIEAEF